MRFVTSPRWWLAGAMLLVLGCGGGEEGFAPSEQVEMMIANLPDSAKDPQRFASNFVAGAAPADTERVKYNRLTLRTTEAKLKGQEGTVKVDVENPPGTKIGDVEWEVVQEGGAWKLKGAPLP